MTKKFFNKVRIFILMVIMAFTISMSPRLTLSMSTALPVIGQISLFPYNFSPAGWQLCDGSLLQIASNDTLFALIGTTYGGDGATDFAVPDMRNSSPVPGVQYYICVNGYYPVNGAPLSAIAPIGEVSLFAFNFIPNGWITCNGATLPIAGNEALFSLIGNNYGGDGISNFKVPDLRGTEPLPNLKYYINTTGTYLNSPDELYGSISLYAFKNQYPSVSNTVECSGQLMPINSNTALFSLLGTTFGGDGNTNFMLPELNGALPSPNMSYSIFLSGVYPMRP